MDTPRSILKHKSSSPRPYPPQVHFPPTQNLTRTFTAYSSQSYDRSPIIVSPNMCALPERGCPGRTYYAHDACYTASSSSSASYQRTGKSLHPRAANFRTPIPAPPTLTSIEPTLVSDHSSESDESDSFLSTPTVPYPPCPIPAADTDDKLSLAYPTFLSRGYPFDDLPPSFPPPAYEPPPEKEHRRHRRFRRECSRERSKTSVARAVTEETLDNGDEQDDEGERDSPDIRCLALRPKIKSRPFALCPFSPEDDAGCLGGF